MPTCQVKIEDTFAIAGRGVFVAARLIGFADFTLGESATIGECPIEPWLAVPRRLLPDGQPDLTYVVFKLRNPSIV